MKNQLRNCTICGEAFQYVTKRGRPPSTCSITCKAQISQTRDRRCSVATCGNKFSLDDPAASPPYFCSDVCRVNSKYSGRQCKYCRNDIPAQMDDGRNNFCSYQCIVAASEGMTCAVCVKPVEIKAHLPWHRVQKYCGDACRNAGFHHSHESSPDNGSHDEAIAYMSALPPLDIETGKYLSLPTTPSGGPFYKVRPSNLPDDFLKQCSPQVRRGVKFREDQVNRIAAAHSDKEFLPELLMQVGLVTFQEAIGRTNAPAPPLSKGYLPSLAEVFPFLSVETRFLLRRYGWVRRSSLYYRKAVSRRGNKIIRLEEKVRLEWDLLANSSFKKKKPTETHTQTAVTLQCIELWKACSLLADPYKPLDPTLYVPPQWIPELTYKQLPSPENNFQEVYGAIQDVLLDETVAWTKALPKNYKPLVAGSGRALWDRLLVQRPIDTVTFAYWFWKMNSEQDGSAKPWILYNEKEFNPDDC